MVPIRTGAVALDLAANYHAGKGSSHRGICYRKAEDVSVSETRMRVQTCE